VMEKDKWMFNPRNQAIYDESISIESRYEVTCRSNMKIDHMV
jgi:hypothetical protein